MFKCPMYMGPSIPIVRLVVSFHMFLFSPHFSADSFRSEQLSDSFQARNEVFVFRLVYGVAGVRFLDLLLHGVKYHVQCGENGGAFTGSTLCLLLYRCYFMVMVSETKITSTEKAKLNNIECIDKRK